MESRQVILLTKGYLSGHLTFKYPNTLSKLREKYITDQIEKDLTLDALSHKLATQAHFIGINPKDGGKSAQAALTSYLELLLPYAVKGSKMDSADSVPSEQFDEWRAMLDKYKKENK